MSLVTRLLRAIFFATPQWDRNANARGSPLVAHWNIPAHRTRRRSGDIVGSVPREHTRNGNAECRMTMAKPRGPDIGGISLKGCKTWLLYCACRQYITKGTGNMAHLDLSRSLRGRPCHNVGAPYVVNIKRCIFQLHRRGDMFDLRLLDCTHAPLSLRE